MTTTQPITDDTELKMKAIIQSSYGNPVDVLSLGTLAVPTHGDDQVLVKVDTASINALDWHFATGTPRFLRLMSGLRTPKRRIPGADVAGTVVEVGKDVTRFANGDRVFGEIPGGAMAEFVAVREGLLAPAPTNIPLDESAALGVAALTALQGLRDWGGLVAGQSVLINGASGGVGTFAIQIARALGASEITTVCSTANLDQAKALGADVVIDYTKEDFVSSGHKYDLMFDNAGNRPIADCRSVLQPDGTLVIITGKKGKWIAPIPRIFGAVVRSMFWSQRVVNKTATSTPDDLLTLRDLVESGKVRPVIERTLPLEGAIQAIDHLVNLFPGNTERRHQNQGVPQGTK